MPGKRIAFLSVATTVLLCVRGSLAQSTNPPATHTLSNGMRIVAIHFPRSTNVSIFTFLPLGLSGDPPGSAQWSHLIEHLLVRSTFPDDLQRANAETLSDHMRLDFYGNTTDWKDGLSHHRRWLDGPRFTDDTLSAEKPKVISECDFTSRNFATHKFALAAWAHAARHSNAHVALKADVLRAALPELQRYADQHLFLPQKTTVCVVGGVDPQTVLTEATRHFGHLTSRAQPVPRVSPRSGKLDITWDLDARHLLLLWPLPDFNDAGFASLMAAGQWLNMQYFGDAQLKRLAGHIFAGTDLATPEGNFFYVSASLRPGASFADVEKALHTPLQKLTEHQITSPLSIPMLAGQLASPLTAVSDPTPALRHAPRGMTPAMIEANLGLAFAMNVHRYGQHRETLARNLAAVSAATIHRAATKHLTSTNATICKITPTTQ